MTGLLLLLALLFLAAILALLLRPAPRIKVLCATCGRHIWFWARPELPRRYEAVRAEHFAAGPYPAPRDGVDVETSCPACGGNPFAPGLRLVLVTDMGVLPERPGAPTA